MPDDFPQHSPATSATQSNADYQKASATSIGELRKQYGPHFAPGYGDNDTLGQLLGRAGVNTIEDYIRQSSKK